MTGFSTLETMTTSRNPLVFTFLASRITLFVVVGMIVVVIIGFHSFNCCCRSVMPSTKGLRADAISCPLDPRDVDASLMVPYLEQLI